MAKPIKRYAEPRPGNRGIMWSSNASSAIWTVVRYRSASRGNRKATVLSTANTGFGFRVANPYHTRFTEWETEGARGI